MRMPGHEERFHATMFLTGALFVFTPIVIAAGVAAVVWYNRRRARRSSRLDAGPPVRPSV
jgi:hypothetical protein